MYRSLAGLGDGAAPLSPSSWRRVFSGSSGGLGDGGEAIGGCPEWGYTSRVRMLSRNARYCYPRDADLPQVGAAWRRLLLRRDLLFVLADPVLARGQVLVEHRPGAERPRVGLGGEGVEQLFPQL